MITPCLTTLLGRKDSFTELHRIKTYSIISKQPFMYVEFLIVQHSSGSWGKPHYFVVQLRWWHCTLCSLKSETDMTPEPALSSQPQIHRSAKEVGLLRRVRTSLWKRKTKLEVFHDNQVLWRNKNMFNILIQ